MYCVSQYYLYCCRELDRNLIMRPANGKSIAKLTVYSYTIRNRLFSSAVTIAHQHNWKAPAEHTHTHTHAQATTGNTVILLWLKHLLTRQCRTTCKSTSTRTVHTVSRLQIQAFFFPQLNYYYSCVQLCLTSLFSQWSLHVIPNKILSSSTIFSNSPTRLLSPYRRLDVEPATSVATVDMQH